ncbi:ATP synthase F1 subunit delta [Halanaerobacter jeridensis]|uniref:ATP synthase subunit delta n=1 Tax=Halanaerobacter jeridensis TaxID=706427 RepID=A0A938XSQ1_9FIRM|nr:ATP synthase F1 subunit delta [Halanaerobacter jeridensis]MBM7557011.1 F-type H+-transporting ATPase subunit delta [Halanaerobacter jeridensis]
MIEEEIAEKYADALFELAQEEDELETIVDEFDEVAALVEENEELNQVLEHPGLDYKQKKKILEEVFSGQLSTTFLNFIKLLIDKKREVYLPQIHQQFIDMLAAKENRLTVAVETPIELSDKHQSKLKDKLQSALDKKIELEIEVKPDLIGGLVLKIGNKVIDGSIKNYLQEVELNLQTLEVS